MALELAQRRPGLRGHRLQVLRALRRHRRRHEHASAAPACGTRRTASTTTSSTSTGTSMPLRVRSMVGLIPLFAVEVLDERHHRAAARASGSGMDWFLENRPDLAQHISYMAARRRRDGQAATACSPSRRASGSSACCATCSTRTSSSRPTASARSRASTHEQPLRASTSTAQEYRVDYVPGESDTRPVRRQLELARPDLVPAQLPADRGARALPPLLRRRAARSSAPPAPASMMNLARGRRRSCARGWRDSSCPTRTGRGPATATIRAYADDPHWRDLRALPRVLPRRHGPRPRRSHQTGWTALVVRSLADAHKSLG